MRIAYRHQDPGGVDLVQTGIREAIENIDPFEHRGGDSLHRWLCRIVEFKMLGKLDHWPAARRDVRRETASPVGEESSAPGPDLEIPSPAPGPASEIAEAERRAWLASAIESLAEPYREVMRRHLAGASDADIARRLGRSPDTVRRARAAGIYKLSRRYRRVDWGDSLAE